MGDKPKVIVIDTRNANDYERAQIHEIAEWRARTPGDVARWTGIIAAPLDRAIRAALSDETIENALREANRLAEQSLPKPEEAAPADLESADAEAKSVRSWAVGAAAAGGAGTGAAGIAGLAVDIPLTVTMALRAIRRTGAAYGYVAPEEGAYALRVLAVASANSAGDKERALAALEAEEEGLNRAASRAAVAKEGAVYAARGLAGSLAKNLAGRKAAQAVPIVGAAVGAAASAAFLDDVCAAARRCYQERFLRDRAVLDGPIG